MNEILMYGPIGPDFWEPENAITAKSVMAQLSEISGDVTVRISSGGGDVYEGVDIMTALKNHDGEVTVIVESLAASAASFIAVGGADRVLMRKSSEMMLHRAWTLAEGNADDVRKTLGDLERQDNKLAAIYAGKAGGEVQDWLDAMSAETWYTAEEAVAAGLADGIVAEKSSAPEPSASLAKRRFKFANRAAAPPPPVSRSVSGDISTTPSDGQIGDKMSILNQLAKELGKSPEDVQNALSGFFNEEVTVTATIDLAYPEDTTVVPTGAVEVAPVGEVPAGVTFEVTEVPDGWAGEVVEDTGVLKVTAPANVEPDTTVEFTVTANGGDAPVELIVPVMVKAAATDTEEETGEDPAPAAPVSGGDTITLDSETYAELKAAAQHGWKAMEEQKEAALVAEVDSWVKEGRISAARRTKAIAAMKRDPEAARDIYGSNPAGTIPRAEIGYGKDTEQEPSKNLSAKADKVGFLSRKNFH
ncbi:head maturation protease, ClpP-related [Corynebacterium jeikeium]|uniref:head maturation protease, ClpP-related n=1 Tax=Corynebacterium jeikeium TaxID=38289 RepID=UPI0001B71508|nr:head maturation protease, ClpP-related [Corynebacterium jeikeium]EEW17396.1 endopeptidase Clp [Corynebacterium jeikeium ATCC 43734]OOD30744.1 peptidase S14 [Corynebacterium jeikeium]WCZ54142.1 ATP-dependent Clp protease proteolytic subunit [Corynebacterium jeikeium]SUY80552.1 ATP-dependent Clp protease proteolytic subunit 2 [Corynebacterium jeikeium]